MVFLCESENLLTKIEKVKQNLIAQVFGVTGISKTITLITNCSDDFCSITDDSGTIHTMAKNLKGQMIYITCKNTNVKRTLLFEELDGQFIFSNFHLIYLNKILYFFYTAYEQATETKTLLQQIITLQQPSVESIVTNFTANEFSCLATAEAIFILFQSEENSHEIQCLTLTANEIKLEPIISSDLPILEYTATLINKDIHIVYLQNMYGQNQLIYSVGDHAVALATALRLENVTLLKYLDCLWINFLDNGILYTVLSVDNGQSFSSPAKSSIQGNLFLARITFQSDLPLDVNNIFFQVGTSVRMAVISHLDTIGIHPDLPENVELEMFMEGMMVKNQQQNAVLNQQIQILTQQLEQYQKLAKQSKSPAVSSQQMAPMSAPYQQLSTQQMQGPGFVTPQYQQSSANNQTQYQTQTKYQPQYQQQYPPQYQQEHIQGPGFINPQFNLGAPLNHKSAPFVNGPQGISSPNQAPPSMLKSAPFVLEEDPPYSQNDSDSLYNYSYKKSSPIQEATEAFMQNMTTFDAPMAPPVI
ncbi:MAG: hypothetical protein ATN31_01645 [Candidatus Epulonipiscioides saccharophilum]|nr:MAG: hypothetical protein ATN31_01645 [Epulopiscium sp. AS2M-Bin001]